MKSRDGCDTWGFGWQQLCEFLDIRFPEKPVWPDDKLWYDWTVYKVTWVDVAYVVVCAVLLTFLRTRVQQWSRQRLKGIVDDVDKCSESVWKTFFYITSLTLGLLVCACRGMEWTYSYPAVCADVIEWYTHPERTPLDIYFFYVFEMGFYTHSIYAHCFTETRRKDFVEMLVHHIATVLLVFCSFGLRLLGCGVVILILHDIADVLFEIAKQLIYRRRETQANIVFAIWVLSWIITRLIYFPLHVIRGAIWGTISVLGTFPLVGALAVFIFTLFILHVVWTFMIFSMIYRMITGQAERIRDTREDGDENTADAAAPTKTAAKKNK